MNYFEPLNFEFFVLFEINCHEFKNLKSVKFNGLEHFKLISVNLDIFALFLKSRVNKKMK